MNEENKDIGIMFIKKSNDEEKTTTELKDSIEIKDKKEKTKINLSDNEIDKIASKLTNNIINTIVKQDSKKSNIDTNEIIEEQAKELTELDDCESDNNLESDIFEISRAVKVTNPAHIELSKNEMKYTNDVIQRERRYEVQSRLEGTVLDLGAAGKFNPGIFTREFAKTNAVHAVDIDKDCIQRFKEINPKLPITNCDAHKLVFDSKSFDTTLLLNVLQFHNDFGTIINEAIRVSRKKVIITLALNKQYPDHKFEIRAKICNRNNKPAFLVLELIKLD